MDVYAFVIAVVSIVASSVVGLYAPIQAQKQQAKAAGESHAREVGARRDERVEERRAQTYSAMLTVLHQAMSAMERAYPLFGIHEDPPLLQGDLAELNGRISAFGSSVVGRLVIEFSQLQREFWIDGDTIHGRLEREESPGDLYA